MPKDLNNKIIEIYDAFKKDPIIVDVILEDLSDWVLKQIGNEPATAFLLTIRSNITNETATIRFIIKNKVILQELYTPFVVPSLFLTGIVNQMLFRPIDNFMQDHLYSDVLEDKIPTFYLSSTVKNNIRPLKGVEVAEYQGGKIFNDLITDIKRLKHVIHVSAHKVVDKNIAEDTLNDPIAIEIFTDIPVKKSVQLVSIKEFQGNNFMVIVRNNQKNVESYKFILADIEERIGEINDIV